MEILEVNDPPERKPGIVVPDIDSLVDKLKNEAKFYENFSYSEHNNESIKQTTYSTITAASKFLTKLTL